AALEAWLEEAFDPGRVAKGGDLNDSKNRAYGVHRRGNRAPRARVRRRSSARRHRRPRHRIVAAAAALRGLRACDRCRVERTGPCRRARHVRPRSHHRILTRPQGIHPMKHATKLFLVLVLAATAILSVPVASRAQNGGRPAASSASPAGAPTQQSWWGEAAAFGCRLGFAYV